MSTATQLDRYELAVRRISHAVIHYPRFEALTKALALCENADDPKEPQCMALEGDTGTGKTTLLRNYIEPHKRRIDEGGVIIPYLFMTTPSPVTVKGMASSMLKEFGDPAYNKGAITTMNTRLVNFIQECGVRMVILDEIQHLIRSDTDKVLDDVSDWLKVLIKETNVPFIAVGITNRVSRILDKNPQLSRLFAVREVLEPFTLLETDPTTYAEFNEFMVSLEKAAQMQFPQEIARIELLRRIYYATNGVVANIVNLVRYSFLVAQQEQKYELDLATLSVAFEKRLGKHMKLPENPFDYPVGKKFKHKVGSK